jgi:mannose-6-phosphate isomerase
MDWHPLRLSTPIAPHVFGGRAIVDRLGREDAPDGRVAETWEVSGLPENASVVTDGPLAGRSLHDVTLAFPDEVVGRGWRGPHFPVLTKFIDGTGMLPVHLHADDETAQRLEQQPNGKTEAWLILDALPGATALVGLKDPAIDRDELRRALLDQRWDDVMRRLPVVPGDTIYVPGGTLHSFGPHTLIYEIEQTSDIAQHAMDWHMEDGSAVPDDERRHNVDALLDELRPGPRPRSGPGLVIPGDGDVQRRFCCACPFFALERVTVAAGAASTRTFDTATILSNVGLPATVTAGAWTEPVGRARSLLLPAALGAVTVHGPADVLVGYLPDLEHDVRAPLSAAGHSRELIASLGEGL